MKNKILFQIIFLVTIILIEMNAHGQEGYFNRNYDLHPYNNNDGVVTALEIDDGYVILGQYNTHCVGTSTYIMKTDFSGEKVWVKYLTDPELFSRLNYYPGQNGCLISTDDGGYAFVGTVVYIDPGISYIFKALLIKFTEDFDTVWVKEYDTKYGKPKKAPLQWGFFNQIIQEEDMGFSILGNFPEQDSTNDYLNNLIRTDSLGNILWKKSYSSVSVELSCYAFCKTPDKGYAIAGVISETQPELSTFLLKTDEYGNLQWIKNFSIQISAYNTPICLSEDGNIVFGFSGNIPSERKSYGRTYIKKFSMDSNLLWEKDYDHGRVTHIIKLDDGSFIVSGNANYDSIPVYKPVWLMKLDEEGVKLWYVEYDGSSSDWKENEFSGVLPTNDKGFLAFGTTWFLENQMGLFNSWLVKTDSMGCESPDSCWYGIEVQRLQIPGDMQIFPNPVKDKLILDFRLTFFDFRNVLIIYDINGKKVIETFLPEGIEIFTLDVSGLKKGIYILEMTYGNRKHAGVKFIKE